MSTESSAPANRYQLFRSWAPGLLAAGLSLRVYAQVVDHGFHFDEWMHFFNLVNYGVLELLTTSHGGHLLWFSNLVYWPGFHLFGIEPAPYHLLALLTHLANVVLLQRVVWGFTERPVLSGVTAALWGCAPVMGGSVGWFAVYGQLLATHLLLWILLDLARAARTREAISGRIQLRWAALLVAIGGCFGFGLAIGGAFFLAAGLMLYGSPSRAVVVRRFAGLLVVLPLLYAATHGIQSQLSGRIPLYGVEHAIQFREVPPTALAWVQGLLLLWGYLGYGLSTVLLGPLLFVDTSVVRAGPLAGMPTASALVIANRVFLAWLVFLGIALRRADRETRQRALGLLLLGAACYAVLALWNTASGRILTEGILQPHMQVLPRYHYLPPLFFVLATACLLPSLLPLGLRTRRVLAGIAVVGVAWSTLPSPAAVATLQHGTPGATVLEAIREKISNAPPHRSIFFRNAPIPLAFPINNAHLPGWAALYTIAWPENTVDGRRVYFIEENKPLIRYLRRTPESRIAKLLVSPEEARRRGWPGKLGKRRKQ